MIYHFNVSGIGRKNLVKAINEHIGIESKYLGAPSFAYQVGEIIVSRDGAVEGDIPQELIISLAASGFCAEKAEVNQIAGGEDKAEDNAAGGADFASEEAATLSISLPRNMLNDTALDNLKNLITAKADLLKRAFQIENLELEIDKEKITFPWFQLTDSDTTNAYMVFVQKIGEMAVNQKRISSKEKEIVNEKYEFRCFLLRLGMIGDEYKAVRKTLMKNLSGSAAFKNGKKKAVETNEGVLIASEEDLKHGESL